MAGLKRQIRALAFAAVVEALAVVLLLPQYLPPHPLLWTLIRTVALNFGGFAFYQIFIYPFYFSPVRHLPSPKVCEIVLYKGKADSRTRAASSPSSEMASRFSRNRPARTS